MQLSRLFLYVVILALPFRVAGQPVTIGTSNQPGEMAIVKESGQLFGLQLATKTRYRFAGNHWEPDGGLDVRLPKRRLPFLHKSHALRDSKGTWLIHAPGFGHLWSYKNGVLNRLDTTFFAGNNFGADRFVFHDTVFSHGGYGFWLYHGVVSYFDPRFKEWERFSLNSPEGVVMPNTIAAFAKKGIRWVWSVPQNPNFGTDQLFEPNGTVYALDLIQHKMEPVGHVRKAVWRQVGKPITAWDSVVLTFGSNAAYLIHMAKNEVRKIPNEWLQGNNFSPMDNWGSGCVALDDSLEVFSTKDRARTTLLVHNRYALRDIWEQSESLGAFLEPTWLSSLKRNYWLPLLTLLISSAAWWWGQTRSKSSLGPQAFVQALDLYERKLLLPLLLEGPGRRWTTHELDDLLETSYKSWDNQRKIRKTTINDLNHKALLHLELNQLISDERDAEDRREKRYFVVPEASDFKRDLIELLTLYPSEPKH